MKGRAAVQGSGGGGMGRVWDGGWGEGGGVGGRGGGLKEEKRKRTKG